MSELISLKLTDVNMQVGYITCRDRSKERMVPFGKNARQALVQYMGCLLYTSSFLSWR